MKELQAAFYAFDKDYRLEADVIRCVHCNRSMHFGHAADPLHHAAYCKVVGGEQKPWQVLVALLAQVGAPQANEDAPNG